MSETSMVPKIVKKSRSAQAFENAFFSLLQENDCNKISISDILLLSGYSRTAFYSNYLDKADFIEKTLLAEVDVFVRCIYDSFHNKDAVFDGLIYLPALNLYNHIIHHKPMYHALFAERITNWSVYRFTSECAKRFENTVRVKISQYPDFDYTLFNYVETANTFQYIAYWEANNFIQTPEYMAKQVGMVVTIKNSSFNMLATAYTTE